MAVDIAGNILAAQQQVPRASDLRRNRLAEQSIQTRNTLAQQAGARTQTEFDQGQQLRKAQQMYAGVLAAERTPEFLPRLTEQLVQMGELDPSSRPLQLEDLPEIKAGLEMLLGNAGGFPAWMSNTDIPANARLGRMYSEMSPDQRTLYSEAIRAPQIVTVGEVPSRLTASGVEPLSTLGGEAEAAQTLTAAEEAGRTGGRVLTPGQRAVDAEFGKEYVEWRARGGYADVAKNLSQLEGVRQQLQAEGADLTGGLAQGNAPDWWLARFDPESLAARDQVEEVVQRNLRLILGAQFTEREGERLIARAYNPRLSEVENAKRVSRLMAAINMAAQAKDAASQYFSENGTLAGWDGALFTIDDFYDAVEDSSASQVSRETQQAPRRVRVDAEGREIGN